jgi:hypothetical protein
MDKLRYTTAEELASEPVLINISDYQGPDSITIKRKVIMNYFSILQDRIEFSTIVYYVDNAGEPIRTPGIMPYEKLLPATNEHRVDLGQLQEGNYVVYAPGQTIPEDILTQGEFDFFMSLLNQPVVVGTYLAQAIARADAAGKF